MAAGEAAREREAYRRSEGSREDWGRAGVCDHDHKRGRGCVRKLIDLEKTFVAGKELARKLGRHVAAVDAAAVAAGPDSEYGSDPGENERGEGCQKHEREFRNEREAKKQVSVMKRD